MNLSIRPLTKTERMYSYTQAMQVMKQSGCIGHLRGSMDAGGTGFYSTWDDHNESLNDDEFKAEFNEVIDALRFDERYGGVLKNRASLAQYCYSFPESDFENNREFGFRADSEKHTYMLRLNPNKGEYNVYCYCYDRELLEHHLKEATKGIRFIDSNYNDLFRIPDGGKIRLTNSKGEQWELTCRYVDDYHFEAGFGGCNLYHICQYAEHTERCGYKVEPVESVNEQHKPKLREDRGDAR